MNIDFYHLNFKFSLASLAHLKQYGSMVTHAFLLLYPVLRVIVRSALDFPERVSLKLARA